MPTVAPPRTSTEPARWQRELAAAIRDPAELCRELGLDAALAAAAAHATDGFPLLVPRGFVARMRPGDPADPLLLQANSPRWRRRESCGSTPGGRCCS
jgi:L-lysine 2,3-aminomutase